MQMQQTSRGILAIVICSVLWSSGGLFIKLVTWHPLAIAGVRSLVSSVFILIYLRRPKLTFSFPQVAAAVCNAATMILFVSANKLTTAANAILLQYTSPVLVALLGWLIIKEKPFRDNWIALFFVSGGMLLFFLDKLSPGSMTGNILAILSGLTFALFSIFMRMQKSGSPLESILLAHWLTFLIGIPFYFSTAAPALSGWASMVFLGVVQVGIASIFFSYGIRYIPAVLVMLIAILEPILNPVWVFLVTGEKPGFWAIIGGLIIVTAVTLSSITSSRRQALSDRAIQAAAGG